MGDGFRAARSLQQAAVRPAGLALAITLLLCGACSGQHSALPVQAHSDNSARLRVDGPALPAPSTLALKPAPRHGSYVEADLSKLGQEFDLSQYYHAINSPSTSVHFLADLATGPGIASASYCGYSFNISGYDRNPQIRYHWVTPPPKGSFWLGLANWDLDRWDWFAPDPAKPLNLASLTPYIKADGSLKLIFACRGNFEAELADLRLGGLPPVASFTATPSSGFAPLHSVFDPSASSDPDGTIVNYGWDFDNDGFYELNSTAPGTFFNDYSATGSYPVRLQVTDNDGLKSAMSIELHVYNEWIHSWGLAGYAQVLGCAYDGKDNLYFVGSTDSMGAGVNDVLVLKYKTSGDIVWAKTYGTSGAEVGESVALDDDGNLWVLGQLDDPADAMLVLKLDSDGAVLASSYYYNLNFNLTARGLSTYGHDVYVCGSAAPFVSPDTPVDAYICRLDSSGALQWTRFFNTSGGVGLDAVQAWPDQPGGAATIHACGWANGDVLYLQLADTDAPLLSSGWGAAGNRLEEATGLTVFGSGPPAVWFSVKEQISASSWAALLLNYSTSATFCTGWAAGGHDAASGLARDTNGTFWLGGNTDSFASNDSFLAGITSAGQLQQSLCLSADFNNASILSNLACPGGAAIAAGGSCGSSADLAWTVCGGTQQDRSLNWHDVSGSWSDQTLTAKSFNAALGTLTGAHEGPGGLADALVVLRKLP